MVDATNLTNHLLIAMPSMDDPRFVKTVTYICEHGPQGALGITINRPLNMHLGEILASLEITSQNTAIDNLPVFLGGPVQPECGLILHPSQHQWKSTRQLSESVSLTSSTDCLQDFANGRYTDKSLIALGYVGWAAGQLEEELTDNVWINSPASDPLLFDTPVEQRWQLAARQLGFDISLLSTDHGHA